MMIAMVGPSSQPVRIGRFCRFDSQKCHIKNITVSSTVVDRSKLESVGCRYVTRDADRD
jgi:hypothetical protein